MRLISYFEEREMSAKKPKPTANIAVRTGRAPNPEGDVYNQRKILLMTKKQAEKFEKIVLESGKSISRLMREAIEAMWPEIYRD